MSRSTSTPTSAAATVQASTMWVTCFASLASSRLRTSAYTAQCSGTTLTALPPSMRPTLAVLSSSRRPSSHGGDGARGRHDGAAPVLRLDAGVRGGAVEARHDGLERRRAADDGARRALAVEDADHAGTQVAELHGLGALQADLLAGREDELHVRRRRLAAEVAQHQEQGRHGRLVVGAEHGAAVAAHHAVLDDHGGRVRRPARCRGARRARPACPRRARARAR